MWMKPKVADRLVAFENADKEGWHEKWHLGRGLLDFPHPWRGFFSGSPGCGKSTTVKNIMIRANPPFDRVIVVHADPEHTKEYDDIKEGADDQTVILTHEIPAPDSFEEEQDEDGESYLAKTLLVIDDLDLRTLNKEQKKHLDRLTGYVSTHRGVSVAICAQDMFNLPPAVRRMISLYVMWRSPDMEALASVAGKLGVKNLPELFEKYCHDRRDSIWIDTSVGTPAKLRLNGFQPL